MVTSKAKVQSHCCYYGCKASCGVASVYKTVDLILSIMAQQLWCRVLVTHWKALETKDVQQHEVAQQTSSIPVVELSVIPAAPVARLLYGSSQLLCLSYC